MNCPLHKIDCVQNKKINQEENMKKTTVILLLILTFFIVFYLQANFFQMFTIAGIMPNLFVIFILVIGLSSNATVGILFGTISGLMIDFVYSKTIGITAVMLCIIGYLGAYFDRNFSKENKITIIIMSALATILFELGYYFLSSVIIGFDLEMLYFVKILAIEVIYNILLVIIFYPLIQKAGYTMDRAFKRNNILTRYF